jgi:hydroxyacylglutathione hydrolase
MICIGGIQLKCIHTPGHTEESSCLLLHDQSGKQSVIFTGDTVFLNEVGRPDLAVKSTLTVDDLAAMLYESIQKVKKVDDSVRMYPGHGSGSACGKSIGSGDFCDIGTQKKKNYGLKASDKKAFV